MLKITKAQSSDHKKLAGAFISLWNDGATTASLELLLRQSFQRRALLPGHLSCPVRKVRFHLDRRAALVDWLIAYKETEGDIGCQVSVVEWGYGFLYSYYPIPGAFKVTGIEEMLSDLTWYHSSRCVIEPGALVLDAEGHEPVELGLSTQ